MGTTIRVSETGVMASGGQELRCVIVDDNPAFIEVAARLLERGSGISIIGTASTIAEAIQRVEELRPDVTLVDVDLGGESGFTLARELHRPNSDTPPKIILISAHSERDFARLDRGESRLGVRTESGPVAGAPSTSCFARA